MNAAIFTEGGKNIGFGHITRCTALHDALKAQGVKVKLVIAADKSADFLIGKSVTRHDWAGDRDFMLREASSSDIAIIDSYKASFAAYALISRCAGLTGYIDDFMRFRYPAGVIINGSINAESLKYPKNRQMGHLLGVKYAYLRKEFSNQAHVVKIKKTVERILVTMGGVDHAGLTPSILRLLQDEFPAVKKTVVIGSGFRDKERIKKVSSPYVACVHNLSASSLKDLMLASDLAISAGGQTLYELAKIGLPTIAIKVASNQRQNIAGWQEVGFIEYAGSAENANFSKCLACSLREVMSFERRSDMGRLGRRKMRNSGPHHIARALIQYAKRKKIS